MNQTKFYDCHIYFDESRTNIEKIEKISKEFNDSKLIISPACTINHEPDKSEIMYFLQRQMLKSKFLYHLADIVSKTFYNKDYNLRIFWRIFTGGNKKLNKVIIPENKKIYNIIKNKKDFLKMWYWININETEVNEIDKNIFFSNLVAGFKFHCYWHNLSLKKITNFLKSFKNTKPIYLILDYKNKNEIVEFLKINKGTKIILGYCGFPLYNCIFDIIKEYENCFVDLASNHIDKSIILKSINSLGSERVIFGSDYPYNFVKNNEFDYDKVLKRFEFNILNLDQLNSIKFKNLKKLLNE